MYSDLPGNPTSLKVVSMGANEVVLEWMYAYDAVEAAEIFIASCTDWSTTPTTISTNITSNATPPRVHANHYITVEGLEAFTYYTCIVKAGNIFGRGPPSHPVYVYPAIYITATGIVIIYWLRIIATTVSMLQPQMVHRI